MANALANSFKKMLWGGQINGSSDTFKVILMKTGFTFDKDAHHCYADISAYEIANGFGYTTGGQSLSGVLIEVDDTTDKGTIRWSDAQWNATGTIVTSGAVIYDDTTATGSGHDYTDAIVGYVDALTTYTIPSGAPIFVKNIIFSIS